MSPMPERFNMVFLDDHGEEPPLTKEDLDRYISFFNTLVEEFQTRSIAVIGSIILIERETPIGT